MSKQGRDALAQVPLFSDLPPRFIKKLADRMQEERFMEGASVVRISEPGETFYVILQGEAKVLNKDDRTVARLLRVRSAASLAAPSARRPALSAACLACPPTIAAPAP